MTRRPASSEPWRGTLIPWLPMATWITALGITIAYYLHLSNPAKFSVITTTLQIFGAVAAGILVAIIARQAAIRAAAVAELVSALYPTLGWVEPSHGIISASGWKPAPDTGTPHPVYPTQIRIRYAPAAAAKQQSMAVRLRTSADDDDLVSANPEWLRIIRLTIRDALGVTYDLSLDRRGRELTATPATEDTEADDEPKAVARLRAMMTTLFETGAEVTDYTVSKKTDHITSFTVSHNISVKLAASGRIHRIEKVVSSVLPGRWRGTFDLVEDTATFELRPTLPKLLWPRIYPESTDLAETLHRYNNAHFYYAEDEDRNPISWNPKTVPHRLVTGPTGSGKTATIHTLITQVTREHWAVNIADRKNIEFRGFRDWPNVQCVATRIEDQIALIHQMWLEMKRRYEAGEAGARTENYVPILLVLDEFTELLKDITGWYVKLRQHNGLSETKRWPKELPTEEEVGSLLRLGRTARIHVIITMQRPDVRYVAGENRDNLTGRQSVGRLSRNGADMMWGDYYTGTTIPPGLVGRGIAYNDHGEPVEVQNYFTPDPYKSDDLANPKAQKVLDALRPDRISHPRIVFDTPFDPHDDETFHYNDYLNAPILSAEDRPDLDPLSPQYRFRPMLDPEALAGIGSALGPTNGQLFSPPTSMPAPHATRQRTSTRSTTASTDPWAGYGSPAPRALGDLQVGDLICIDAGRGLWGILDQEPEPDPLDPDAMLLSWRSADDDYDTLSVHVDDPLLSRPLPEDDDESAAAA